MKGPLLIVLAILALLSCSDFTAPPPFLQGEAAQLEFTASAARTQLVVGDTVTLTFTLRNPGADTVRLDFSSCGSIRPFVFRGSQQVYARSFICTLGGGFGLTLPPGVEVSVALNVRAIEGDRGRVLNGDRLSLPRGTYVAFAELVNGDARSTSVRFRVH